MSDVKARIHGNLGPYKGYLGSIEYDAEDETFHGKVLGTNDVITFEADGIKPLLKEFQASVDDYLDFCRSRGESPEKPFSGKFVARLPPTLHKRLSMLAESSGVSLNQFVVDRLSATVDDLEPSKKTRSPRNKIPAATRPVKRGRTG
jgi:predicted HicB family RNase H-like nuclease